MAPKRVQWCHLFIHSSAGTGLIRNHCPGCTQLHRGIETLSDHDCGYRSHRGIETLSDHDHGRSHRQDECHDQVSGPPPLLSSSHTHQTDHIGGKRHGLVEPDRYRPNQDPRSGVGSPEKSGPRGTSPEQPSGSSRFY